MNNKYTTILFDLDGTLTDPALGITNSVMHALEFYNIHVSERSELFKFIGPPLIDSFMKYYNFDDSKAREAVTKYREYFSVKGLFENEVYSGVTDMLKALKAAGKKIVLATSKPDEFSIKILKHFGLYEYFDFCACSTMDETRTKKTEVIEYGLANIDEKDTARILMVGDREHDIFGAGNCGLDSVGVLYGYGNREEFENAGATYIVESVEELKRFLLAN